MRKEKIQYADDDTEPVKLLVRLRVPSLIIGLLLGLFLSFVTSRFEKVLSQNVSIAFFLPFIVYMADAVGTQTQNIYARDLKTGKASFKKYLLKESALGLIIGMSFGFVVFLITVFWLKSLELALAVSLATFCAIVSAPLVALFITQFLQKEHTDPAVGAGPLATIIQDAVSVMIYGLIASLIIL